MVAITTFCDRWGVSIHPDETVFKHITNGKQPFIYPTRLSVNPQGGVNVLEGKIDPYQDMY